jgi:hypothetical protein
MKGLRILGAVQPSRRHSSFRPRLEPLERRDLPSFVPGLTYKTGTTPLKPALADFNRDGRLDVAVATCFIGRVSVLLGQGDGTLLPYKQYPTQSACPYSTQAADMNGDGIPDIEVANSNSASVSVLLGVGDGTFRPPLLTHLPYDVFDLVARDFNGDGVPDVAAVAWVNHLVYVLLGNGDGTLKLSGMLKTGPDPIQIDAGDFNNDGAVDLVVADQNTGSYGSFNCFLGKGDGTFTSRAAYPTGGNHSNGISAGDFNNDGRADVVVSNAETGNVSVLLGKGDGTFQPPALFAAWPWPAGSAVGDFNHDGSLDVAVALPYYRGGGGVVVLLNDGAGAFRTQAVYPAALPFYLAAGDLNGDGYPDLIASNHDANKVTVFLNDGSWAPPLPYVAVAPSYATSASIVERARPTGEATDKGPGPVHIPELAPGRPLRKPPEAHGRRALPPTAVGGARLAFLVGSEMIVDYAHDPGQAAPWWRG